jgi:predicted CoA-binding protein
MPAVYGVSDETVREILTRVRTIAVVGASPNPARPSNKVLGFLVAKGFETYPVNPRRARGLIRGRPIYARLADVPAAIDMVDVFRNSPPRPAAWSMRRSASTPCPA